MRRINLNNPKTTKKPLGNQQKIDNQDTPKKKDPDLKLSVGNDFDIELDMEEEVATSEQPVLTFKAKKAFTGSFKNENSDQLNENSNNQEIMIENGRVTLMSRKRGTEDEEKKREPTGMMRLHSFGKPPSNFINGNEKMVQSTGQMIIDSDIEDAKEVFFNRVLDSGVENTGEIEEEKETPCQVLESNFNSLPKDTINFD